MRNIADTAKNNSIGYPIKPNHIANNLYGIGVTAVNTIINIPYFENIGFIVDSINAGFENVSINQTPTESYNHNPIIYAMAPPTIDPSDAATVIGRARRLFAIIGGVMKTSGGINKNIDSHMVRKNTNHEYPRDSDFFNINSENFIFSPVKNLLDCNLKFYTLQYNKITKTKIYKNAKKTCEFKSW